MSTLHGWTACETHEHELASFVGVERLAAGNPGDARPVGEGVSELRIDYGPGYRVYFKEQRSKIVILLAGGNKQTQSRDIKMVLRLARNL